MMEEVLANLQKLEIANTVLQEARERESLEKHRSSVRNDTGMIATQLDKKLKKSLDKSLVARQQQHEWN